MKAFSFKSWLISLVALVVSLYVATGFGIGMELGVDFNFNICNWRPVYVEIFVFYGIIGIILLSLVYYRDHQRYLESKEEE